MIAAVPTRTPRARLSGETCVDHPNLDGGTGWRRPWVDAQPAAATLVWFPGLNFRPCRAATTELGRSDAEALADVVRAAPAPLRTGSTSCPMDDGRALTAYFTYAGRPAAEIITFRFTGCMSLTAPNRGTRTITGTATELLTRVQPSFWSDN